MMLFSFKKFASYVQLMNSVQKKKVIKHVALINLLLLVAIVILGMRIRTMKVNEEQFIQQQTMSSNATNLDFAKFQQQTPINAKIYMIHLSNINLKDNAIKAVFSLSLSYLLSDFNGREPKIMLDNGLIRTRSLITKKVHDGKVDELINIEADLEPNYLTQLYPLDKQVITLRLGPKDDEFNYYVKLNGFYDYTAVAQDDYRLTSTGYLNQIESYTVSIGDEARNINILLAHAYMLVDHKNIYTYIKSIQYIILSLFIAVFSLLLNSKTNSPKNGRVAVIGSAVFSLAANILQINSTIRSVNLITLIDLITIFTCLIILLSFLVTVRALQFVDEDGYETSKVFDLSMFWCLMGYSLIFFTFIYCYV